VVVALFTAERLTMQPDATPIMPSPISSTYLRQAGMVADILLGRDGQSLGEGPRCPRISRRRVAPTSLLVLRGVRTAPSPTTAGVARRLDSHRAPLRGTARASGLDVVSGFVQSPTFGGSSWLAHVSFLTGSR
jgi:hypothetical protein